jgi:fibronectin-binding autotransporter adhesin
LGLTGVTLLFDSSVGSEQTSSTGLWLPTFAETGFSGIVPFPNDTSHGYRGTTAVAGKVVATNLWNFAIASSDPRIVSVSTVGFFFAFTPGASGQPLYAARLDMTAGAAVPANWYYKVKPYSFAIHDVTKQRGGVTILNNVIDPTRGETVRLSYQLKKSGAVTATVFTLDGDVVARLVNESNQGEGDHSVSWDGRNLGGRPVARGLYFIRIVAPGMDEIRKVIVVRK